MTDTEYEELEAKIRALMAPHSKAWIVAGEVHDGERSYLMRFGEGSFSHRVGMMHVAERDMAADREKEADVRFEESRPKLGF